MKDDFPRPSRIIQFDVPLPPNWNRPEQRAFADVIPEHPASLRASPWTALAIALARRDR